MNLRGNATQLGLQLLTGIYAIYTMFAHFTTFSNILDDSMYWPFIALTYIVISFANTIKIIQFENYIEYCENQTQKLLKEAIRAKKEFDKQNKK